MTVMAPYGGYTPAENKMLQNRFVSTTDINKQIAAFNNRTNTKKPKSYADQIARYPDASVPLANSPTLREEVALRQNPAYKPQPVAPPAPVRAVRPGDINDNMPNANGYTNRENFAFELSKLNKPAPVTPATTVAPAAPAVTTQASPVNPGLDNKQGNYWIASDGVRRDLAWDANGNITSGLRNQNDPGVAADRAANNRAIVNSTTPLINSDPNAYSSTLKRKKMGAY